MDPIAHFQLEVEGNVQGIGRDKDFLALSNSWNLAAIGHHYAYNFSWMGRPIIQTPQDTYAIQELIWNVKPDLVIETGIAHGGSLIMSASMLALLDYSEAAASGAGLAPLASRRRVIGVDVEIRPHNRQAILGHPLCHLIEMIEGSSVDPDVVRQVVARAQEFGRIMVMLDSNHTHEHVLAELKAYAPLVSRGSYCVVWDTGIEDLPSEFVTDRPWGKNNNPKTAVREYLAMADLYCSESSTESALPVFEVDKTIEYKLAITAAPDGFLKRVG